MIRFGLGWGIFAATVSDAIHHGFDGLTVGGIVVCSLLIYSGARALWNDRR